MPRYPSRKPDEPRPPSEDVKKKQDPDHTQEDFLRSLDKATNRLDQASEPDQESPKTKARDRSDD